MQNLKRVKKYYLQANTLYLWRLEIIDKWQQPDNYKMIIPFEN